MKIEDSLDR